MRCHLTPVRIAIIEKRETEQVLVSLWKNRNPCILLAGIENAQQLWK